MAVNALKTKPFSDIKNLTLSYPDSSLKYIHSKYATSEGFNFSLYDALNNYNDCTINNYSYFFLGKKELTTNWLKFEAKKNIKGGFVTTIQFDLGSEPAFLYFQTADISQTSGQVLKYNAPFTLRTKSEIEANGTDINDIGDIDNFLFTVEFIPNSSRCYIKHISSTFNFYLYHRLYDPAANDTQGGHCDDLWFTTDPSIYTKFGQFNYLQDESQFLLFFTNEDLVKVTCQGDDIWVSATYNIKKDGDQFVLTRPEPAPLDNPDKYAEWLKDNDPSDSFVYELDDKYVGKTFTIKEYSRPQSVWPTTNLANRLGLADNPKLSPTIVVNEKSYNVLAKLNQYNNDLSTPTAVLNTSWVAYDDRGSASVNLDKSEYDIKSQALFHLQYNNIDGQYNTTLNIIPLKTIISPTNNVIRGDYLETGSKNSPNIDFREYTTLDTGSNQELGTPTVTLTYTFYDDDFIVNPGEDLVFTVREDDIGLPEALQASLYPFKQINIKDTKFIKNGAFGSSIPFLADKVKKLQSGSKLINNGRYLYTWLYQTTELPYGIWLDRYYYPDVITKREALSDVAAFQTASFSDLIDADYLGSSTSSSTFYDDVKNATYFDKQSDLVIEPNTQYMYSRTGTSEINVILDEIKAFESFSLDKFTSADHTITIDNAKIKESGELDLSFDMYLEPDANYGPSILASSQSNGLSITNDKEYTPFEYSFNNTTKVADTGLAIPDAALLMLHNANFDLIKVLDINSLYHREETILKLIIGKPFEDVGVLTDQSFYLLSFDLITKEYYNLTTLMGESTIKDVKINSNFVYFLFEQTVNDTKYHKIYRISLSTKENNLITEIKPFTKGISRVAVTNTGEYYPVYFDGLGAGNIKESKMVNGTQYYTTIDSTSYPLPYGLQAGVEVSLTNSDIFDKKYWFYCPNFESAGVLEHNTTGIVSIHIDASGLVYAMPYYLLVDSPHGDDLYGVRESSQGQFYQIENFSLSDYRDASVDQSNRNIVFLSYVPIYSIAVDDDENIAILKLQSDVLKDKAKKELQIYNKAKSLIYTRALGTEFDDVFALDTATNYEKSGRNTYFTLLTSTYYKDTDYTEYKFLKINNKTFRDTQYILNFDVDKSIEKTTEFSNIIKEHYENSLDFTLTLPVDGLINDTFIYRLNLDNITAGWYNIRILINLNTGTYKVWLDERELSPLKSIEINKFTYNNLNVFNYPLILGETPYKNGIPLTKFLERTDDDLYKAKSIRIRNLTLHAKELELYRRQALILSHAKLQPLVFTLPGGQKNNVEEIVRYFTYTPPGNVSNTVRINIKNSGITDLAAQQSLSLGILQKINDKLSCPVTIKEINFIQ